MSFSRIILGLLLLMTSFGLLGCAGSENTDMGDGEIVIGLTDAEGDFTSYTVDVLSLTLTQANGTVVETLPLSTRVDFAQYTEMTEFLTAATVPNGAYTHASMVLDYSNADIWVENAAGDSIQVTHILDIDGAVLGEIEVSVALEGRQTLVIAPGVPGHLTLDFDLKASNRVEFDDQGVVTQIVEPFLLADVVLETPKIHRLRGPLASVNVEDSSFEVILRPFHQRMDDDRHRDFGALNVISDDSTVFDIDGEVYEGNAGLVALESKPIFTAMIVVGDLKINPRRFVAREVYAGSSVPGGDLDVVTGNVIARDLNTLTIKGATLVRAGGSVIFNDVVTVELGDMTTVRRQRSMENSWTIDDVSVGQRVRIFGTLTNNTAMRLEMDAGVNTEGRVQMRFTHLRGRVVAMVVIQVEPVPETPFVIELQAIDGRRMSLFDFTGTGIDADNDADPLRYEIETGSLDISSFNEDMSVGVRGFVRSFGSAPKDFDAQTLIDASHTRAMMAINWEPASAPAIAGLSSTSISFNLDGAGRYHQIKRDGIALDLTTLEVIPDIIPYEGDGVVAYRLAQAGVLQLHTSFAEFATDLESRLAAGSLVKRVSATGKYDDAEVVFISRLVTVVLE